MLEVNISLRKKCEVYRENIMNPMMTYCNIGAVKTQESDFVAFSFFSKDNA